MSVLWRCRGWGAVMFVCSAVALSAGRLEQTREFQLDFNSPSQVATFAPFDPTLGNLQSVEISYALALTHDWALWNSTSTSRAIEYEAQLKGPSVAMGAVNLAFGDFDYGVGLTGTLPPTSLGDFLAEFLAARAAFLVGDAPSFPSAAADRRQAAIFGGVVVPISFPGSIELLLDPGTWSIAADNAYTASFIKVNGTLTATYHYATVAEVWSPGLLIALMLSGVAALRHTRTRLAR